MAKMNKNKFRLLFSTNTNQMATPTKAMMKVVDSTLVLNKTNHNNKSDNNSNLKVMESYCDFLSRINPNVIAPKATATNT